MKTIQLTQGYSALVDDADYDSLAPHRWWREKRNNHVYAVTKIKGKRMKMHRMILGLTNPKEFGDHIDGNGLNNQRYNLRVCTQRENNMNRKRIWCISGYKGVTIRKTGYVAKIRTNNVEMYLGIYKTPEAAALAYNAAAIKYHGEFASLNTIPSTAA